jgi:hypothetical protein
MHHRYSHFRAAQELRPLGRNLKPGSALVLTRGRQPQSPARSPREGLPPPYRARREQDPALG